MIRVSVNGEPKELPARCTVERLLDELSRGLTHANPPANPPANPRGGRNPATHLAACAVEVNRRVIPRRNHATATLADGDAVEIVTLVGGG